MSILFRRKRGLWKYSFVKRKIRGRKRRSSRKAGRGVSAKCNGFPTVETPKEYGRNGTGNMDGGQAKPRPSRLRGGGVNGIDMMAKSWDASRLKAGFPARKKGAGKALMGRRVSAVRAGVREPVAEVW